MGALQFALCAIARVMKLELCENFITDTASTVYDSAKKAIPRVGMAFFYARPGVVCADWSGRGAVMRVVFDAPPRFVF